MSWIKRRSASNSSYGRNSSFIFGAKIQIQSCNCSLFTTLKEKNCKTISKSLERTYQHCTCFSDFRPSNKRPPSFPILDDNLEPAVLASGGYHTVFGATCRFAYRYPTKVASCFFLPILCSSFTQEFNNTQGSFTVYMSCNQFQSAAYKSSSVIILTHVPSIYPWHSVDALGHRNKDTTLYWINHPRGSQMRIALA